MALLVCVLRARGAWHFCAVGTKMPNVLIAACVTQGNALGWAYALINTFGILAVQPPKCHAPLARNLVRDYFLFVTRFLRVAFLSRRLKNAECVNRGVRYPGRCPGLWATFGLTARLNHLPSFARHFSPPQSFAFSYEIASKLWRYAKRPVSYTDIGRHI